MKDSLAIKQQSKHIQQALRELEYSYEIEHVRPVHNFVVIKKLPNGNEEYDDCLSRDEFNISVEEMTYIAPSTIPCIYGYFVRSTGGFTRVKITRKDGSVVVGKHNFKSHDNFFKSLGFVKAVFKAVGAEISPVLDEINQQILDINSDIPF